MQKQPQQEMEDARMASWMLGIDAAREAIAQDEIDAANDRLSIAIDEWRKFLEERRGNS